MEELPRILIVDDDELVREVLRDTLTEHFSVEVASTGGLALEILRDREFAVMVADQRMPQITGVELVTLARNLRPNLVSIILSAYTDPKVMISAINEGQIFRFVRKPWDVHDLILTLNQGVERYELARQNERLVADLERRLAAFEILDEVTGAMLAGEADHPMGVLLDRLQEIVPHDVAALLLCGADADEASLELRSSGPLSEANAAALRDQAVELFGYFSQREIADELVTVRAELQIDHGLSESNVGSQVEVPLKRRDEVVGVLVLQAAANNAFPPDATRLLDRLANGTAEGLVRLRSAASREWGKMEHALAALPDGVVWADCRGAIQFSNATARRLLAAGQPLDGSIWSYLGLGSVQFLDRPEPAELDVGPEARPTEVTAVTTTGGPIGATGILVVLRDLSRIEDAVARQREFVSTFSHEIRTPLSSISAAIDLLLAGFVGNLSDKQRDYLNLAAKARDGLNHMVDQLLDLERYARGAVQHETEEVAVAESVQRVVDRFEPAAVERKVTLALSAVGELPSLQADPRRLEQVLGNLINNGIKFAAPGTEVSIAMGASGRFGDFHVIAVRSEGVGIAQSELDSIFDRFRQAKRKRRDANDPPTPSGSGLGLSICRSIIDGHAGAILAESDDCTTTFWVVVPSRTHEASGAKESDAGPVWIERGEDRDVDIDAAVVGTVLSRSGLRVRLAPRDPTAFAAARQAVGDGLVVTLAAESGAGTSSGEGLPVVPLATVDGETLAAVAEALRTLTRHAPRELLMAPEGLDRFGPIASSLGVRCAASSAGWTSRAGNFVIGLIEMARHIDAAEESLFPVKALIADTAQDPHCDTFGVVRLDELSTFRLAYGAAQAQALRRALGEQLRAAIAAQGVTPEIVELPAAAVFAAGEPAVAEALAELERRFGGIARLYYRREDRERGSIKLGDDEAPLVRLVCEQIPASAGEAGILAAVSGKGD